MKAEKYLMLLCITAATGGFFGMLSNRKSPGKGGFAGVAAGIVAGASAAGVYHYITQDETIPFYSNESPLYKDLDAA